MQKSSYWLVGLYGMLILVVAGCRASETPGINKEASPTGIVEKMTPATATFTFVTQTRLSPTLTPSPTQTTEAAPSSTVTIILSATSSPEPTLTFTPTITPTYSILRATVLEQSNCRYGPGAAYLYKYGLYPGNNIEVIGRNETGTWVVIQAIGGTNPCWVKASLLEIHGEVMNVAQAELPLPLSPYYGPVTGVYAERTGNQVIISWNPIQLRAGDDSLQFPYLVEAWLCQGGQLTFNPIGSWEPMVTVTDEPGCQEPSHARVYGVEKHGYTLWVTVPWPAP